jgi:nitrous oxide reductase
MKINRRSIAAGLAAGVLAGGAVDAIAATTLRSRTAGTSSTTPSKTPGGWDRYGHGWSSGGTAWRDTASGVGWARSHGESARRMTSGSRW